MFPNAKDPASYSFNQVNLRNVFKKFLTSNTFEGFGGVYHDTVPTLHRLNIEWGQTWDKRCANIREQHRNQINTTSDVVNS